MTRAERDKLVTDMGLPVLMRKRHLRMLGVSQEEIEKLMAAGTLRAQPKRRPDQYLFFEREHVLEVLLPVPEEPERESAKGQGPSAKEQATATSHGN